MQLWPGRTVQQQARAATVDVDVVRACMYAAREAATGPGTAVRTTYWQTARAACANI